MHIDFLKVRYKNFLSVGNNFLEIDFSKSGRTLIVGRNGHGKSSMLDAIYFALFGRPFRNINKGKLVNSINKKDCVVELEFKVGSDTFLTRRGINPNIFEIYQNGTLLDQNANLRDDQKQFEKNILGGLTPNVFRQLVVLGSASYVPFMQLTASQRREVIENLLDIKVFSVMNSLLKDVVSENKKNIQINQRDMENVENLIQSQEKLLMSMEADSSKKKDKLDQEIKLKQAELESVESQLANIPEEKFDNASEQKLIDKSLKLRDFKSKIVTKIQGFSEIVSFFDNHDTCPTCSQIITEELAKEKIDFNQSEINKLKEGLNKLQIEQQKITVDLDGLKKEKERIIKIEKTIVDFHYSIRNLNNEIKSLEKMKKEFQPVLTTMSTKDNIEDLKIQMQLKRGYMKELLEDREVCSLIVPMLKDGGVKAKVIQRYIPIINQRINHYLEALDFFVQFTLDEEFNEKILSRHRDEFEYNSFSEGEKLRIDIAILFTWRDIMKMRNTITTNLLIMDEILDRSIDQQGADEFLKLLNEVSSSSNVFVISHRGTELADKFNRTLKFEKQGNYTTLVNE